MVLHFAPERVLALSWSFNVGKFMSQWRFIATGMPETASGNQVFESLRVRNAH